MTEGVASRKNVAPNPCLIEMRLLLIAVCLLCTGCSQTLLTKQDYAASEQDVVHGSYEHALLDFPDAREKGAFITTMEKGYLSLLEGKPQIRGLEKQVALQENQVRYHVSREARTFFYVQTPEDYYPGEHEVIWLHFLLSWGYSLQGKYTDACVEARVASSLLTLPWSQAPGHFDDPAMRLFLAGLWTMCGEWREAQVDLRAAWFMDNSLVWAKDLADRERPPKQLFIVLGGPGPEVVWDPELTANPLRSARKVRFQLRGRRSALSIADASGAVVPAYLSPDASNWYERYVARETELHELIQDSAYGGKAAASTTYAAAWITATTTVGIALAAGGTVLGGAIIYYGATADAVKLGLIVAATSISAGWDIAQEGYEKSTGELKQELNASNTYRFVRFLPEYLWMGWSDRDVAYPVKFSTPVSTVEIQQPSVVNGVSVTIAHLPDSRSSCSFRRNRTGETIHSEPDEAGNCAPSPDF